MSRLFIRLLVLICLAVAVWTAWVFFQGGATLINGLILAVDVGVLVWNFWVMKKMHIGFGSVILTGIIIAIIAIPTSLAYTNRDTIKSWVTEIIPKTEQPEQSTSPPGIDSNLFKKLPQEKEVKVNVTRIQRSNMHTWELWVTLAPTSSIEADTKYIIRLYENGALRDESNPIIWNKPEINVQAEKQVYFGLSEQESQAYGFKDLSDIFSIKAFEVK